MMFNRVWLVVCFLCVSGSVFAQEDVVVQERVVDCSTLEGGVFIPCEFVEVTTITREEEEFGNSVYVGGVEEKLLEMGKTLTEGMIRRVEKKGESLVKKESYRSNLFFEKVTSSFLVYEDGVFSVRTDREVAPTGVFDGFFLLLMLVLSIVSGLMYYKAPRYRLPASLTILVAVFAGLFGGMMMGLLGGLFAGVLSVVFSSNEEYNYKYARRDGGDLGIPVLVVIGIIAGVGMGWHAELVTDGTASKMGLFQWAEICVAGALVEYLVVSLRKRRRAAEGL